MLKDKFQQRKKDILSKQDKSSKGYWDKHILELCKKINSLENYYTTSSCSGRIVLIIDQEKKEGGLLIKVYHDLISFEQLKKDLNDLLSSKTREINCSEQTSLSSSLNKKVKTLINSNAEHCDEVQCEANDIIRAKRDNIKFKFESCALHIACKNLKDAQKLYDKSKLAGWKRSGIIASESRFVVELNSTEKLEFPIIEKNKILVDDYFLKIVIEQANKKLEKSWEKIERLNELINEI